MRRSQTLFILHKWAFVGLLTALVGLCAWLSYAHRLQTDVTRAARHTLSPISRAVLDELPQPISVTSYTRAGHPHRQRIEAIFAPYQRYRNDLELRFVDPDTAPDEVRELGVRTHGELVISYNGRSEHQSTITEQAITNSLQALGRSVGRWVVFTKGHGERSPTGGANYDFGLWGKQLTNRGLQIQSLDLSATASVPDNTAVLVLASPQTSLLPGEVRALADYVGSGGNLLWFRDPDSKADMSELERVLGVEFVPGTVVDPASQLTGIEHPAIVVIKDYPAHASTEGFSYASVLPFASAITAAAPASGRDWEVTPLLVTTEHVWSETGALAGNVGMDPGLDTPGPFALAVALIRKAGDEQATQRVAVFGDGDFLSNTYLGNGGNLDLGLRLVTWLAADDRFITVPARVVSDQQLKLERSAGIVIAIGFLFVLPILLIITGVMIWRRRKNA